MNAAGVISVNCYMDGIAIVYHFLVGYMIWNKENLELTICVENA